MTEQAIPDTARVSEFLYQRLSAQTILEVYEGEAPLSATLPLISYNLTPRPDLRHKLGTAQAIYRADVKVVYRGSSTYADEPMLAIERALNQAALGGVSSVRIQPFIGPSVYVSGEEEKTNQTGYSYNVEVL